MPYRRGLCLIVAAFVACSCGEIPEPEGFAVASTTSVVAPDEAAEADDTQPLSSDAAPAVDFIPRPPEGYLPEVLAAVDGTLVTVDDAGTHAFTGDLGSLGAAGAIAGIDDFLGGIVVQRAIGEVVWIAQSGDADIVEESASLLDVGYVDGSPSAIVLLADRTVDRVRLVDNERTMLFSLDDEEEILDLSASGGLHAVVLANERCGDLRFYAADGALVDLDGPGEPDCIVPRRAAYGAVALSPDGTTIAYTVVTYRDDGIEVATELVVRDLTTGEERSRLKIGEDGDRVVALGYDGTRVVHLRRSGLSSTVTLLDLELDGAERFLDVPATGPIDSVTFARNPLASFE